MSRTKDVEWETRGKTIGQLIKELRAFEDDGLMVEISLGEEIAASKPISLVVHHNGKCVLLSLSRTPTSSTAA